MDFNKIKVGENLSEHSFFVVTSKNNTCITVSDSHGNEGLTINRKYCESILMSGDQFSSEKKVTMTELANLVRDNINTAMSIYYQKVNKSKTKKAYKEELSKRAEEVKEDFMNRGQIALEEALKNPVLDYTLGEMRLIRGYNPGGIGENGFFNFVDMEDKFTIKSASVNPRTIEYIIVNNVKYIKK